MNISTILSLQLAALAGVCFITPAFAVVSVEFVPIGNPGNSADPMTGLGAVGYTYNIGKYETTISQYASFLNAAAKTDPHGVYDVRMASDARVAGISRSGASGAYTYSVTGSGSRPIAYVSWYDAARLVNWMHNGQGSGSTETGAYTLNGNFGLIPKNAGARVWLPSEAEWYKAAFYDPTPGAGGGDNYWLYPTRSDVLTDNTVSANYFDADYVGSGNSEQPTSNALTDVGDYSASASHYGTFDQGGNVWELTDTPIGSFHKLHGGSWQDFSGKLRSTIYGVDSIENYVGFRIATVPEPSSLILMILAGGLALVRRTR